MADVLIIERRELETGEPIYGVFFDQSRSHGILRVTNEIDVNFKILEGNKIEFLSAWEIGCGGCL